MREAQKPIYLRKSGIISMKKMLFRQNNKFGSPSGNKTSLIHALTVGKQRRKSVAELEADEIKLSKPRIQNLFDQRNLLL